MIYDKTNELDSVEYNRAQADYCRRRLPRGRVEWIEPGDGVGIEDALAQQPHEVRLYAETKAASLNSRRRASLLLDFDDGCDLLAMKNILPHGRFLEWVDEFAPFSLRHAQNCMNIKKTFLERELLQGFTKKETVKELSNARWEESTIAPFLELPELANALSMPVLRKLLTRLQSGELTQNSPEFKALLRQHIDGQNSRCIARALRRYKIDESRALRRLEESVARTRDQEPLLGDEDYDPNEWEKYVERLVREGKVRISEIDALCKSHHA